MSRIVTIEIVGCEMTNPGRAQDPGRLDWVN